MSEWIEWKGGASPVKPHRVEVRYRDGDSDIIPIDIAMSDDNWAHEPTDPGADIVAYMIVQ